VKIPVNRRTIAVSAVVVCVAAALLVWAFARPHRALEYMVAGTLATSVGLLAVFFVIVKRRLI